VNVASSKMVNQPSSGGAAFTGGFCGRP